MIAAIRHFYRSNFYSPTKVKFLKLFDENETLYRAIVLEERSPLAGIQVSYVWQEFDKNTHLIIREVNFKKKTDRVITERELPKEKFVSVIRQIEEAGGVALGSFNGKVKDGIFYCLCRGSPSNMISLNIQNPQHGSKQHQEFITMLKTKLDSQFIR